MLNIIGKLIDSNEKQLKRLWPAVAEINNRELQVKALTDSELIAKTAEFKNVVRGELDGRTDRKSIRAVLDKILPEAFAVCREAIRRTLNERAFDVQLLAAIVLHEGKIAEQKTGEGKTQASAIALYLNALTGLGVHMVTVNDYLARRDAGWYGRALNFLGLSVGCIVQQEASFILDPAYRNDGQVDERLAHLRPTDRKSAYAADITFGTNSEFGFDYLRDNMAVELPQMVQRGQIFAVVDEVDFALIDEARTPLIISQPAEESTDKYVQFSKLVEKFIPKTDYVVDEKARTANITSLGISKVETWLGIDNLYEKDFETVHHLEQALKAKVIFHRDQDYVVKDGEVMIVDEFTGRLMPGRRYSEGLHQAIEAKEGVAVQRESKTLAAISLQNYFRKYGKLAGMTGTAVTEAEEFFKIYKLEVVVIPPNRPLARRDENDLIFKSERAKWQAVMYDIEECRKRGQPVLVGTTSIEKNELLRDFLNRKGIEHEVLNAKQHEREALIFAQAGRFGAVTIATNMAGRGVDIKLGGEPTDPAEKEKVMGLGGLRVIGTERHEARRIDNQLRGRSGRQGEPGSTRFYLSLQDDLMRRFGGDQVGALMSRFGLEENIPLEHGLVSRSIESAQKRVEGYNFDARKHLVDFDDVLNKQREIIYTLRRRILSGTLETESSAGRGDIQGETAEKPAAGTTFKDWLLGKISPYAEGLDQVWVKREKGFGPLLWSAVLKQVALPAIDMLWMEHLTTMEDLREGIGLRGYGGRDPLVEYKNEGHKLFEKLVGEIYATIANRMLNMESELSSQEPSPARQPSRRLVYEHKTPELGVADEAREIEQATIRRQGDKVGRNDPCPCGAKHSDGRSVKYKHCHGRGV